MPIDFACNGCSQRYRVKEEFAGKATKCKKCGTALVVPRPPEPEPEESNLASLLDEELGAYQPERPLTPPPPPSGRACPACNAALADKAVVCVDCGYDLLNKRSLVPPEPKGKAKGKGKRKGKKIEFATQFSPLLRGIALSAVGAGLGAIVWAIVAVLTEREIGWIAWAVGLGAGGGMSAGYDDKSDGTVPGIIAAFMALGGIVLGKVLIVVWLVLPLLQAQAQAEPEEEFPFERMMVTNKLADDALAAQGIAPEQATAEQKHAERMKVAKQLDSMPRADLDRHFQAAVKANDGKLKVTPEDVREARAIGTLPQALPEVAQQPAEPQEGLISAFFRIMFGPMDALFILLAFFTAYKIGSGGSTD